MAEHLVTRAPEGMGAVYFVSGGSEANETAMKLARQYFLETGEESRHRFIARQQSYHGNTLGALAVGGNVWRRAPYAPLLIEVSHIEPCYAYRHQAPGESEEAYGKRAADALEAEILRLGPESVAGFFRRDRGRVPRPAWCRRCPATSRVSARFATATACS